MIPVARETKPLQVQRKSIKNFLNGTVTAFSDGRTPISGLKKSNNVYLSQDGTVGPRPSLTLFGTQPPGTVLGQVFEFKKVTGTTIVNVNLAMCNVSGVTKPYYSQDGGSWTRIDGKSFSNVAAPHYCEVDGKVLIFNGVDNLSYVDIPTAATIPFVALTTPTAPTLTTNTGLTGTTFTITYRITANSTVGETVASSSLSVQVSTDRDLWNPSTQSLLIAWSAVTSAKSYNVYMGTVAGFEYLIAEGVNGLAFLDNGTAQQDVTRLYPTTDSTIGPIMSGGRVINGQVFMWGDTSNLYLIRFGGTDANVLDFSPANGGGYSTIGRGTKEIPIDVEQFRDGRGVSQITVLCQGAAGRGKRYIMTPDSLTLASTVITFFDITEDNGQDGTESPYGVIQYNNSLYYPSRDGFKTTGTMPQLQNVLSSRRLTNTIQGDVKNLTTSAMAGAVGLGFEGRLYWALPVGSSTNNQIWVLDLDRQGAWMEPWDIKADWMWLYEDSSGITHFLMLVNNQIVELSTNALTNDLGIAFPTSGASGIIAFSDDGREWAKLINVIFVVLDAQGIINFNVQGWTDDEALLPLGTETLTSITSSDVAGWGEGGWGDEGWSDYMTVPDTITSSSQDVIVEIDEEVKFITYDWDSQVSGVDYQIADVILEYIPIGIKDLS